ncbi:hypothetical protein OAM67_01705 [bacterium]|nr:hypothetical protein [bacterium]
MTFRKLQGFQPMSPEELKDLRDPNIIVKYRRFCTGFRFYAIHKTLTLWLLGNNTKIASLDVAIYTKQRLFLANRISKCLHKHGVHVQGRYQLFAKSGSPVNKLERLYLNDYQTDHTYALMHSVHTNIFVGLMVSPVN